MKILPALKLAAAAPPGTGIIETSSGTMALALAMVCAAQDRSLVLVTPPLETSLGRHIRALGQTKIVEVAEHDLPGGNQSARLRRVQAILDAKPDLLWTRQYENRLVLDAYDPVGTLLAEADVDCLVAPVGSGGSALGMIRRLRQSRPTARLVAVDAVCSVLFGRMDGPREFPGMGNSIMPPLLDHTAFNEVHWVPDNLIAHFSKETARRTGLLLGPSGAAALLVARWWARQHKDTRVACVLPDQGTRYLDTLYANDAADVSDRAMLVSDKPAFVRTPQTQSNCWEAMLWGQRSLKQVVQHAAL